MHATWPGGNLTALFSKLPEKLISPENMTIIFMTALNAAEKGTF